MLSISRRHLAPLLLALSSLPAAAQSSDSLRFMVPFPAGGAADSMGRVIVQKLKDEMKQNIIVENKPGAGTRIAAEALKNSAPDGRMVLAMVLDTIAMAPLIYSNLRYDAHKDFAPITMVTGINYGIAVKADGPYKTLQQYIEAARADKTKALLGVSSFGSPLHFLAFDFARQSKAADMQLVQFQGGPAMVSNLLGSQSPAAMDGLGVFTQHHLGGRLRVLAVSGEARAPLLPEVPTFKEAGMPSLTFSAHYALFARAGSPEAKINEWNAAMRKVLAMPEVRERVDSIGYTPIDGTTPAEVRAHEQRKREHWGPLIKATGFNGD